MWSRCRPHDRPSSGHGGAWCGLEPSGWIMTTCPGYVHHMAGGIDACGRCYRGEDHPQMRSMLTYQCLVCGRKARFKAAPVCCNQTAVLAYQVPIPCAKCGEMFKRKDAAQKNCESCPSLETQVSRAKRAKAAALVMITRSGRIPCATCIHGKANQASDSGWECIQQIAGRCGPYGVARYYEERK